MRAVSVGSHLNQKKGMKNLFVFILVVMSNTLLAQTDFQRLSIKVNGIKDQEGQILIALFDSEENFLENRVEGAVKPVAGGTVTFTFDSLKQGVYAISVFHDINSNKELDSNFIGIPTEPYAFSNNAKGSFGPPKFEDCKFEIVDNVLNLNISL